MGWMDILERLKGDRSKGGAPELSDRDIAANEKRKGWRVHRSVSLKGELEDGSRIDILAVDFGAGGMRIECAHVLNRGDEFRVRLARPRPDQRVSLEETEDEVRVKVCWGRPHDTLPTYVYGVSFQVKDDAAGRATARFLLEDCKLGIHHPREKRRAPRARPEKMRALFATADGTMTDGGVHDLAVGGALLFSPREIPPGEDLRIRIFLNPRLPGMECRGTVVRCAKSGGPGGYELGVLFTEVAPDHAERLITVLASLMKPA